MTCPRPHSNAIAKSRLSGPHAGSPAFSYLAAFPARQGPEARTSGTSGPSAQSRMHACGRGQGGERWEAREGHSLPITKLRDVEVGAGTRRRAGGSRRMWEEEEEATAVRGAEPYPFQSLSSAPRPRVAPSAPSFVTTGFQEQQHRLAQTWTSLLTPCAPCSLSRKCPAGFTKSFLASHQSGQDHTVFNHIFCIFSCIPD